MATVRFSGELTSVILANAAKLFEKRLEDARANIPKDIGERVYERGMGRYITHFNNLPHQFFRTEDTMRISKAGDMTCQITCKFLTRKIFPVGDMPTETMMKYDGYSFMSGICLVNTDGYWDDIISEIKTYHDAIDSLVAQQRSLTDSVKAIITAHATLAPALKVWPALWDLLPESTKNKHKEIVERKKSEVTVDVDLGSLTAAVAFSKLTR